MGLSWINPLYLAGLLLLAVPVLIHLVQKHQRQGARFPSLLFLQQIPQRQRRRLEIRHWLLLLLRCLLILLLVLAFARPFLESANVPGGLTPEREDSIIVLDRSYSMRLGDHWQQALDHALQRVDRMQTGDRIGVLLVDEESEPGIALTSNADELRALLRGQSPGLRATRLPLGIEQASRLLAASNASRKKIVVISDFQASAVSTVARISDDIELEVLPVEVTQAANASISSVDVVASSRAAADEFSLRVEISNRRSIELEQVITLTLDGRERARRPLRLPPGARVVTSFDGISVSEDLARGVVSLDDDALDLDNHHYFVYSSRQRLPLLIVEGSSTRTNQSVFLQNALRLSRAPAFHAERIALDALSTEDLPSRAAIILNDVSLPAGALADAFEGYVAAGGALLVIAATAAQPNWPSTWLPGRPGRVVSAKPASVLRLADFDPGHPLGIRAGAGATIDLSLANVFSYRELRAVADDEVVARYSDGGVALVERRIGKGRVQVLTTTVDTHWNDIALQPAFPPFLQQKLRYLTAYEAYSNQSGIGDIVDLLRYARALAGADVISAATRGPLIVQSPTGSELRIDRQSPLLTLAQPGFYQVHQAARPGVEISLAANVDPHEANPEMLDLSRFVGEIKASAEPAGLASLRNRQQAAELEQRQQLAQAILLAVLLLIMIEALSANWLGMRQTSWTGSTR